MSGLRLRHLVIAWLIVLCLGYLFLRSQRPAPESHQKLQAELLKLEQFEDQLARELVELRYGRSLHYDRLRSLDHEISARVKELSAHIPRDSKSLPLLLDEREIADSRRPMLERFASENSTLNNSSRALPRLMRDLDGLDAGLNDQIGELVTLTLFRGADAEPRIEELEANLKATEPTPALVATVLGHVRIILNQRDIVDDLTDRLLGSFDSGILDRIRDRERRAFQAEVALADAHRPWLFGTIAFAALALLYSALQFQRTSQRLQHERHERDVAVEMSRTKSEFLANMSHEIRTPINGILGMTQILAGSQLSSEQREQLEIIARSSDALLGLINDILDYSKIEAGHLHLEAIPFDLDELLRDASSLFESQFKEGPTAFVLRIDSSCRTWLLGDPLRLRQVVFNLVSNAKKFTEQGSVELAASVSNEDGKQRRLRIDVRDTGIGIPADRVDKIFRKFEQAESSTTRQFGGTGLGLAIVRDLANMMGGDATVSSVEGEGSTFSVEVLLEEGEAQKVEVPLAADERTKLEARVLLVDDNDVNRLVATKLLERLGCEVSIACDGAEAVESFLEDKSLDLILMDYQMPVMDGTEATRRIRELPDGQDIPIIAMTAAAMPGDREICLDSGMNDYISKPVKAEALDETLRRAVAKAPPQGEA